MNSEEIILLGEEGARRWQLTESLTRTEFDAWLLRWTVEATEPATILAALIEKYGGAQTQATLLSLLCTPDLPPLVAQRDPRWHDLPYTQQSPLTFGTDGCFVCALTSLVNWVGYNADPPEVAAILDAQGAFSSAQLLHPERLSKHFSALGAYRRIDWSGPADLAALQEMLAVSPVVVQMDFKASWLLDPHFGLAYVYIPDLTGGQHDSLMLMDPWDGAYIDAAADVQTNAAGKRTGGGYFWPEWWDGADMAGTEKTRVQRVLWGARHFAAGYR